MINLFDNAIGAIKKEGQIKITLTCDSVLKKVHLEIADSGEGISDEEKTRLFEPYFSTKSSGVGLGLAIVKKVIKEHGGEINVQSELGERTTFSILLAKNTK